MTHYSINHVAGKIFAVYEHATGKIVYKGERKACQTWIDTWVMYLRKEPYVHHIEGFEITGRCVRYYRDPEARVGTSIWYDPWPSRPTRRNRWVMFNCARYRACWLEDLK